MQDPGAPFPTIMASRWTLPGSQTGKDGTSENGESLEMSMMHCSDVVDKKERPLTCKLDLIKLSLIFNVCSLSKSNEPLLSITYYLL